MNWQADEAVGEARRGGTITLTWAAFGARIQLQVVELIPYESIVLRHGESVVEMRFQEELVTLRHRGPEADADAEGLRSSWKCALAQLAHSVERHPGRQRRIHWLVRSMQCSAEAAHLCFTEELLLRRWLTESGQIEQTAERYELTLKSGQKLQGRVLAFIPGRDIAVTCDSFADAVLTFRTLPSPTAMGERIVALAWSEWGRPRSATVEVRDALAEGMLRLSHILDGCPTA